MKTLALVNQKGGVGKTTTCINLCRCLSLSGYRVLAIDMDPQAHTSFIYGGTSKRLVNEIFEHMFKNVSGLIEPALELEAVVTNLSIIKSSIRLALTAEELGPRVHREKILSKHLKTIEKLFDFVIIDCPPTLGVLSINAIYAADHFLIPVTLSRYAMEGMRDLLYVIRDVKETDDFEYSILLNGFDKRNSKTNEIIEADLDQYGSKVLTNVIRKAEAINQAQINQQSLMSFDHKCPANQDYHGLMCELLERLENGN